MPIILSSHITASGDISSSLASTGSFGHILKDGVNFDTAVSASAASAGFIGGGSFGDFSGPGSSTDNAVIRFDGTGGKTGQNSGVTIDDSDNMTIGGDLFVNDYARIDALRVGTTSTDPGDGNLVVEGDITIDDGGSLKEGGGTAAITFDGSGNVTKIGQDSPGSNEYLKWDGSKWVADGIVATVEGGAGIDAIGTTVGGVLSKLNAGLTGSFSDNVLIQTGSLLINSSSLKTDGIGRRDINISSDFDSLVSSSWDRYATYNTSQGLFFTPDGKKVFHYAGTSTVQLYQYALTKPFDFSTMKNERRIQSYYTNIKGIYFSPDGRKFFHTSNTNDAINMYRLERPYTLPPGTQLPVPDTIQIIDNIDNGPAESAPKGITFSRDGRKFYTCGGSETDAILQYSVTGSEPYEINSLLFEKSIPFNESLFPHTISGSDGLANIQFSVSGEDMFVLSFEDNVEGIFQFKLSSSFDIGSAMLVTTQSLDYRSPLTPSNMFLHPNMSRIDVLEYGSTYESIISHKYNRRPPMFISEDVSYEGGDFSHHQSSNLLISGGLSVAQTANVEINNSVDMHSGSLDAYSISRPLDITKFRYVSSGSETIQNFNSQYTDSFFLYAPSTLGRIRFTPDGSRMFVMDKSSTEYIYTYELSEPFEPNSQNNVNRVLVTDIFVDAGGRDFAFNGDGTKMYLAGLTYDGIVEIDLATPYYINPKTDGSADINDLKYISLDTLSIEYENSSKTEQIDDNILSLEWGDNGRKLYVLEGDDESIYEFHVTSSVPYNIHALKPVARLNLNYDDTHIANIVFTPDGSHLLFAESSKDNIYQYDLKKNWDIKTAELSHKISITGSNRPREGTPSSFVFKPNFSEMFLIGTTYDEIERFRNDNFFSSSNEQFNIRSGETNIYGDLTVHGALSLPAAKQFKIQDELRITSGLNALSSSLITKNITGEMPMISVDNVNYIGSASLDGGPAGDSGQYPTTPASIRFTPDGYTFYLTDRNSTEYIYKYSLKKPFEILIDFDDIKPSITKVGRINVNASSGVIDSEAGVRNFRFNPDGSKVFILGHTNDGLIEAPLENPYDVLSMYGSGLKIIDLNLVPGSPDDPAAPIDFQFRPDGRELFVVDSSDDVLNVYEVTGSKPYDIHALKWKYQWTPSYVNTLGDSSYSFEINQQGSEMLFVGNNNDLFQYSLKKPWDLRTARTKGYLFNISGSGETSPLSVNYKPDQTGFYILGSTLDKIQIFNFVETGSLDLNMSPTTISGKLKVREGNLQLDSGLIESTQPLKSNFGFDGASGSMDIGVINNPLRLPFSSSFHVFSGSISSGTQYIFNFRFRPDGREIYYLDTTQDRIYYDNFLDKPFDMRTLTDEYGNLERYVSTTGESGPKDFAVSSTGKHVYVIGGTQDGISQYQLTGSAFEIGSLDLEKTMDLNLVDGVRSGDFVTLHDPRHIFLRPDNRRAYVSFNDTYNGTGNGVILQFDCTASSDHFDAGALRVTGRFFDGRGNTSSKISFNDVGTQLFLFGDTTEEFELYDLNTPWDITTANFVEILDAGQIATALGVRGSSGTHAGQFYKDSFYIISSLVSGGYRHPIVQITPNKEHPIIDGFGFNGESGSINPIEMGGTVNIRGELQVGRRLNVMGDISQSLMFPTTASFNHVIGTSFAGDGASLTNVPDYVYEPTYDLKSINELEEYVFNNKHLPNVPDMNDFKKWKNLSVGDRDMLLLEKIEELSLYIIELNKRIEKLENK